MEKDDYQLQQKNFDLGMLTLQQHQNYATSWADFARRCLDARGRAFKNYSTAMGDAKSIKEAFLQEEKARESAVFNLLLSGVGGTVLAAAVGPIVRQSKSVSVIKGSLEAAARTKLGQAYLKPIKGALDKMRSDLERIFSSVGTSDAYTSGPETIHSITDLLERTDRVLTGFAKKLDKVIEVCKEHRSDEKPNWGVAVYAAESC